MEKKNDSTIIPDDLELLRLIESARHKDTAAMMKLIELYKEDIRRFSNFIYLPNENAISAITLEFLELILNQDKEKKRNLKNSFYNRLLKILLNFPYI